MYFNPGRHRFKGDLGLWRGPLPESLEVITTVHRVTSRYQHVDFCLRSGASLSDITVGIVGSLDAPSWDLRQHKHAHPCADAGSQVTTRHEDFVYAQQRIRATS